MSKKEKMFFVAMIYGLMAMQNSAPEWLQIAGFLLAGVNAVLFIRER